MHCTVSEEEAKLGARRLARCLQKLGFQVKFTDFKVVNVLAVCTMPFEIRLPEFTNNNRPIASYEPELHPAATYRIKSLRATLQIFSTGNITVTGIYYSMPKTHYTQSYSFVMRNSLYRIQQCVS
uniref:TATA box-binding protein-like 1 n=1 Tax=Latimeria chalumnae TaxID=7897 RepID=H2ZSN0_LATCH